MSGGGGGGGWYEPTENSCDKLTSETTLSSPNAGVLAQLQTGMELDVEVDDSSGARVIRATYQGQIAGSITSAVIQKIADCIEQGYAYVAEVLSVHGGACRVRVRVR